MVRRAPFLHSNYQRDCIAAKGRQVTGKACHMSKSRQMSAKVRRRAVKVLPIAGGVRRIAAKVCRTANVRRIDVRRIAKVGGVGNCHSGLY
jgi:hypothetical protein